jgi:NADPH:quinone reductase-like Zn-dependent oxidoreductase
MKAVRIEQFGPVKGLRIGDVPNAAAGRHEAIVEIRAAGINPSDVKNVHGEMKHTVLPRIPGRDFAGVVSQGPRSHHGMEVWGTGGDLGFTREGTHAQFLAIPVAALQVKPRKLSFEQAAAVGVIGTTALGAIKVSLLKPEKTILIIGAAGGVGAMAAQIAKWKGSKVIGAVKSPVDVERAKAAGAEAVFLTEKQNLTQAIREYTKGHGVDVVLNTVGGPMFDQGLACLTTGGRQVEITVGGQPRVSFDLQDFYRHDLRIIGFNSLNMDCINGGANLHELTVGFESGALRPPQVQTIPLDNAVQGYEAVEKGSPSRIVLLPS